MAETYGYEADRELEELYAAITGRPAFSYTPGSDPLYRSYAERAVQNGRLAMRDTQGQAAALTGGYGSSYAQSVGQQRYDEYLRSLGEALPEFYNMALQRYNAEGEALRGAYDLGLRRSQDAYQRSRDAYQRGRDALADERYAAEQAAQAEQQRYKRLQESYSQLYKLIASTGYEPTDEELREAGLSRAQAEALRYEYQRANGLLEPAVAAVSGGGYRRKSKSKSKNKTGSRNKNRSGSGSGGGTAAGTAPLGGLTAGALAGLSRYGTGRGEA